MSIPLQPSAVTARNHLLDCLPVHERNAILRGSRTESYAAGHELTSATSSSEDVFFPVTAVVSVLGWSAEGETVPLALVGAEGLVGVSAVLDGPPAHSRAIVRAAGFAHRVDGEELRRQFRRGGELQKQLLRFAGTYLGQISQNIVCNRLHGEEGRLARWLLMVLDRNGNAEIEIPLPALANVVSTTVIGTGRLLRGLVHSNILRYQGDVITVLDREGLEVSACGCYEAARFTVERRKGKR